MILDIMILIVEMDNELSRAQARKSGRNFKSGARARRIQ